ncbi:MAG: NADH dehydrogenase [Omnitrophica bacterium GWA2_52_12]|nr:MAG: NADH dehydrogenase [Omnitrophica bacterium GWA2_52_12]
MPNLHEQLKAKLPQGVLEIHAQHGDETALIRREAWIDAALFIREDPAFHMNVLMDLTAVDGRDLKWKPRFEVVAHFYSTEHNQRLRLKVAVEEKDAVVPTLTNLWPSANWFEREVWDMFGIRFDGHPDLRRLLMYTEFKGHPLRKDYLWNKRQPLIGPKN